MIKVETKKDSDPLSAGGEKKDKFTDNMDPDAHLDLHRLSSSLWILNIWLGWFFYFYLFVYLFMYFWIRIVLLL